MKKRGQALVEFVLILPFVFLIMLGSYDIANVFYQKIVLENHYEMLLQVEDKEKYLRENNLSLTKAENEMVLQKEVALITPGIGNFIEKPFVIETRGTIYE